MERRDPLANLIALVGVAVAALSALTDQPTAVRYGVLGACGLMFLAVIWRTGVLNGTAAWLRSRRDRLEMRRLRLEGGRRLLSALLRFRDLFTVSGAEYTHTFDYVIRELVRNREKTSAWEEPVRRVRDSTVAWSYHLERQLRAAIATSDDARIEDLCQECQALMNGTRSLIEAVNQLADDEAHTNLPDGHTHLREEHNDVAREMERVFRSLPGWPEKGPILTKLT